MIKTTTFIDYISKLLLKKIKNYKIRIDCNKFNKNKNRININNNCDKFKPSLFISKNLIKIIGYLIFNTKDIFMQLRQIFIQVLILQYFDLKYQI